MHLSWLRTVIKVSVLASLLTAVWAPNAFSQGVSVAPLRVLFDGRTRSATVFLSNRTTETATYRIALVNRRMEDDGAIVVAEEAGPGEYFADELIRFSPRRVTIAPFGSQTIRLLVRRPRGEFPEDVEFRTHLAIRSIPPTPRLQDLENQEKLTAEGKLSVKAVATIETVIPILVRFGDPQATLQIANPALDLKSEYYPTLQLDLVRGGDRSVYGELEIVHIAPDGTRTQIHYARGLAVYSPTPKRRMTIALKKATPQLLSEGRLLVRFVETEEMHGDQEAELLIQLGKELAQAR